MSYFDQYHLHHPTAPSPSTSQLSLLSSTAGSDMEIELEDLKPGDTRSPSQPHGACYREDNLIRGRYVWTTCATVSLLSSRYLLVDLNVHFPLHVHLIQLALATLLAVLQSIRRRPMSSDEQAKRPKVTAWILLILVTGLMATAMVLNLQAILHFRNPPTLVMLSMLSYLVKLMIIDRSRFKRLRCLLLAISCAGILYGEYRLHLKGLVSAIPAALLAGLAGALYTVTADYLPEACSNPRLVNLMLCCAGLAITTYWTLQAENTPAFLYSLKVRYIPMLTVNTLSTAMAILVGKSFLFPIDATGLHTSRGSEREHRVADAVTALALTGVVGCATTITLHRSYTSWLQILAFLVALFCICGHSLFDTLRNWRWNGRRGYALLPRPSGLESMDSENTMVSEEDSGFFPGGESINSENTMIQTGHSASFNVLRGSRNDSNSIDLGSPRSFLAGTLLIVLAVLSPWIFFPAVNFQDRLYVKTTIETPHLDLSYNSIISAELVISMYKEPVSDVSHLISTLRAMPSLSGARVHIYIKDSEVNLEDIKSGTRADNVTMLPNVGREGETYLYHILTQWDSLAKHTVFLQADIHNPREFYPRVRDYYNPFRTGMLSLGWAGNVCNCGECGDRWSWWDTTKLLPQIHNRIYGNETACDKVMLSYKGQFIASAARIRGIDKAIYHDLREAFVDENSWAHQEEYLQEEQKQGRQDSMSAPAFGYTMERIWNLLLQCSSADVAWKCPTLLSGVRMGGNMEDCQCFDPAMEVKRW